MAAAQEQSQCVVTDIDGYPIDLETTRFGNAVPVGHATTDEDIVALVRWCWESIAVNPQTRQMYDISAGLGVSNMRLHDIHAFVRSFVDVLTMNGLFGLNVVAFCRRFDDPAEVAYIFAGFMLVPNDFDCIELQPIIDEYSGTKLNMSDHVGYTPFAQHFSASISSAAEMITSIINPHNGCKYVIESLDFPLSEYPWLSFLRSLNAANIRTFTRELSMKVFEQYGVWFHVIPYVMEVDDSSFALYAFTLLAYGEDTHPIPDELTDASDENPNHKRRIE